MNGIADRGGLRLEPYWWEAAPPKRCTEVPLPDRVDVAVIGAGYAGLSAALTLARAGRAVAVLEAEEPGWGASTRNGGICSGNLKIPIGTLIDRMGLSAARAIYAEGQAARRWLADFIGEERIECGFAMVGRFTGANTPRHYEALAREAERLRKHVGLDVHAVPRSEQQREIGTDRYHGGEVRGDIGGLHPGLFHAGLVRRVLEAGVRLSSRTRVLAVLREGQDFELHTARGVVSARHIVGATNGYTDAADPWIRRRIIPIPSQIIATRTLPADVMARLMPKGRMLGDTARLYNYYRPSPDGTRILFGGRAGATKADPRRSGAHLRRNMLAIFPELADVEITHAWSGLTGYTFDLLPHIGVRDGIHFATGFCGSGVVWAPYLGRKVALKILGREAAAATPFDAHPFQTRPLYRGRPWFLPAVVAAYGTLDRLGL